jgi:hypothetical protein
MSEWLSACAAKPLRRDISPELAMNSTRPEADEGARLESEAGERHQATSKSVNVHAIRDLAFSNYHAVCIRKPRGSSRF